MNDLQGVRGLLHSRHCLRVQIGRLEGVYLQFELQPCSSETVQFDFACFLPLQSGSGGLSKRSTRQVITQNPDPIVILLTCFVVDRIGFRFLQFLVYLLL